MVELEEKTVKGKQRNLGRMGKHTCRYDRTIDWNGWASVALGSK
jgi:hypothetical protein